MSKNKKHTPENLDQNQTAERDGIGISDLLGKPLEKITASTLIRSGMMIRCSTGQYWEVVTLCQQGICTIDPTGDMEMLTWDQVKASFTLPSYA